MQMTRQASALETDVIEVMRVSISPESVLVVLEINLTQLIRAGESYYFKIDDRTLDILTTDSGIVEAYQCFAWRKVLKQRQPASSLTWVNESPEMLEAWVTLKQYREARVMLCSPEGDSLRDVLQDHMPLGPHGPYSE
ncbi:hypothetical protein CKAH01_13332 [Colletotrichum kahawae]|uniref:Uncharacterized protein n=1 Tax=Colletotrichum kahawae TaxID=34407 RepID=A0AAD9YSU5_COLKA|nr:hypothetical protein CKAH01_13332 [Colletotrichum kahawae]